LTPPTLTPDLTSPFVSVLLHYSLWS
jgi:hypothetical protein